MFDRDVEESSMKLSELIYGERYSLIEYNYN